VERRALEALLGEGAVQRYGTKEGVKEGQEQAARIAKYRKEGPSQEQSGRPPIEIGAVQPAHRPRTPRRLAR
jgi:hypothetical protein